MRRIATLLSLAAIAGLLAAGPVAARQPGPTIVGTAIAVNQATGEFDELIAAVSRAGLVGTLDGNRQFTVFAPTDAAFAKLPKATLNTLMTDKAKLKAVLLYHVVPGKVTANEVAKLSTAKTANGKPITIRIAGGNVFVNGAKVTKTDVMATNGVIHVINRVLIPPT